MSHVATAFGLVWQSDMALELFAAADANAAPGVTVRHVSALRERSPIASINQGHVFRDGIRLHWQDEAVFDMFDGAHIEYLPGPEWPGSLPISFYSTIAALTVAWRGLIPFHGSAVEVDGKAVLVCGDSGAGKSTIAAGLVEQGANFISDDLSVVGWSETAGKHVVYAGRPTLRLYPGTASWLKHSEIVPVPKDKRGKQLVRPLRGTSQASVPLAMILRIGPLDDQVLAVQHFAALKAQLFRPRWMALLPNSDVRKQSLLDIAKDIKISRMLSVDIRDRRTFDSRVSEALSLIRSML